MAEFAPISTAIGTLFGRNAIYLDEVSVLDHCNTLVLSGEFSCRLASKPPPPPAYWQAYRIRFHEVLTFQMTELDTWEGMRKGRWPKTSFDEVIESEWLAQMRGPMSKAKPAHRHFVFMTYDWVFEIICTGYELELKETRAKDTRA